MTDDRLTAAGRADRKAVEWLTELRSGNHSPQRLVRFQTWLADDPQNKAAFERLNDLWDLLGSVDRVVPRPETLPDRSTGRRRFMAKAAACVAAATVLSSPPSSARTIRTVVGRRRDVPSGGGRLRLDCDTTIVEILDGRSRTFQVVDGQIYVIDPGSAFLFREAQYELRPAGGRFNLRKHASRLDLTTITGMVHITDLETMTEVAVAPGLRASISPGSPLRMDRPQLRDVLAWLDNRIVLHNERLRDVVATMNRYDVSRIVLGQPALGDLRLSGSYPIGSNRIFARSLETLLPLRAVGQTTITLTGL